MFLINKIIESLEICKVHVETLPSVRCKKSEINKWFKKLCENVTRLILNISERNKVITLACSEKHLIILYLSQVISYLSLCMTVFEIETELSVDLERARGFIQKQLSWCLHKIQETLSTNEKSPIFDGLGSFIKWMDTALSKLDILLTIDNVNQRLEILEDIKDIVEEALCHSMSIAQVDVKDHFQIIKGASQMVLEAIHLLTNELNQTTPKHSMITLYANECSSKLCALERKVNNAVLKLTLKTFGVYPRPLENLDAHCSNTENRQCVAVLENLTADFDLHVDCIMQIGLFAVSCSTSINRGAQIRSFMASLDALEGELVPELTAKLSPVDIQSTGYAKVLKHFWMSQANLLKRQVYLVIEPFAFCEVIFERNADIVKNISMSGKQSDIESLKKYTEDLLNNSKVLEEFVTVVSRESEIEAKLASDVYRDFKKVKHEVNSAKQYFFQTDNPKSDDISRFVKRCKILLTTTRKLWYCFGEEVLSDNESTSSIVLDYTEKYNELLPENKFLNHIIEKGKQRLKDKSLVFPNADSNVSYKLLETCNVKKSIETPKLALTPSKFIHLRNFSFTAKAIRKNDESGLQITDILNEITNISSVFLHNSALIR